MSYWSHHPEQYDQIIYDRMVDDDLVSENDDRDVADVVASYMDKPDSWKLAMEAERDHWAGVADAAENRADSLKDR